MRPTKRDMFVRLLDMHDLDSLFRQILLDLWDKAYPDNESETA